jgi:hypothetical protein
MTISTYAELKTAIATYARRADLTGRDDEFIDSVEALFARRLRIRAMETKATGSFTANNQALAYPTDFRAVRTFSYTPATGVSQTLDFITTEQGDALDYTASAQPVYYTFAEGGIRLYPTPDQAYAYTLLYYKKIVALDGSNTTNYLLTNHPDAYLAGCLVEAFAFLGDLSAASAWQVKFDAALREIERADARERFQSPQIGFDPALLGSERYSILTDSPL